MSALTHERPHPCIAFPRTSGMAVRSHRPAARQNACGIGRTSNAMCPLPVPRPSGQRPSWPNHARTTCSTAWPSFVVACSSRW
eukprot:5138336-Lingulodinium_polyedra.AAC.1